MPGSGRSRGRDPRQSLPARPSPQRPRRPLRVAFGTGGSLDDHLAETIDALEPLSAAAVTVRLARVLGARPAVGHSAGAAAAPPAAAPGAALTRAAVLLARREGRECPDVAR